MKTRYLAALLFVTAVASAQSTQTYSNNIGNGSAGGSTSGGSNDSNASNSTAAGASDNKAPGGISAGNADDDWAALNALSKSAGAPKRGERSSPANAGSAHERQVAAARSTAAAARAFYTQHPTDARVGEARKLEAVFALRGVVTGDSAQENAAIAIATGYRVDRSVPAKDRMDVALVIENQSLALKLRSGLISDSSEEKRRIIRGLRAEFGPLQELDTYAVATARHSNPRIAHALASEVVSSATASVRDQREAKRIKERSKLLGHTINLSLPLADGGQLDLGAERGHVTIVVVWSPSRPEALDPLAVFERAFPRGTQVIGLALGGTKNDAKRIGHTLPVLTKSAFAPLGATTKSAIEALKVHLSPYVYVLNREGVLTDFGTIDDLPDVLTRAGVTKKKTS
jgi:hypothetical protein